MSKPPELRALVYALSSLKWSDVKLMAIHLPRMDFRTLNMIEEGHPTEPTLWVVYAMDEWLQRDTEASWAKVVSALRETKMNSLATKIEKDYPMTTPHLLEPRLLSSHSASLLVLMSSAATASMPSLEHIAMSSLDEATCSPLDEIQGITSKAASDSASHESQLMSSAATVLVPSLEHIAISSPDEATCSPLDEIEQIKIKAALLRTRFTRVLINTKICFMEKEVEESGKFLRAFQVTLTSLPGPLFKQHEDKDFLKEEKIRIKKAKDVDEILDILEPYWNYVDYDLLEHIIKLLGTSDLQEEMKEYITELEQFERATTVHDFSLAIQEEVPARYGKLAVKLKKDPKRLTLHDVRQFKKSLKDEMSFKEYTLLFQGRRKHAVNSQLLPIPSKECHYLDYKKTMSSSVSFRRFLSSFANKLDVGEADQIAYIRTGSTNNSGDGAFRLLLELERRNVFSFENPSGLIEVARDIGREDLVQSVKEYVEMHRHPMQRLSKRKPVPTPSKECQHLENVHDSFVSKCVDFESEFQKTWKDTVTREEGLKLIKKGQKIAQDLLSEMKIGENKLKGLSSPSSGSSISSNDGSESNSENSLSCE